MSMNLWSQSGCWQKLSWTLLLTCTSVLFCVCPGKAPYLSELRIVLLGSRSAGKSSAGNTILNREEFGLKTTAWRQGEVAGRHITVVEAPGWSHTAIEKNTELLEQEIVLSVSLCPPGPHCLLLVIRVNGVFKENEGHVLNGYMQLFSQRVWSHTIVLFTFGDYLVDRTIQQYIESEGKTLQWLVEKCRNRYHVLNNKNRSDDSQVTELLEKIEEMVAANRGRHFKMGRKILVRKLEEMQREEGERAKEMMAEKQSKNITASIVKEKDKLTVPDDGDSAYSSLHPDGTDDGESSSTDSSLRSDNNYLKVPEKHEVKKFMNSALATRGISTCLESRNFESVYAGVPDVFMPEMIEKALEIENHYSFRFLCPHAGQFQCRVTGLVFEMEGKGEVLYRIDSWDTRLLDGLGQMQPAGPLYNIKCFEGSVSYLHFPHCEIFSGEYQLELVVAHFTGDNIEVISPLIVTNTYVVTSIQGLSLFGLLKNMIFNPSPISAQVLLFYKEISGKQSKKKLHIHLLPRNVPVEEVQKRHKGSIYFETSSTCQLIPGRKYKPSCDTYEPQPKSAQFECDYGPNYHPTFVVFFEADDVTVSLVDEDGTEVWEPHEIFLSGHNTDTALIKQKYAAEFVDQHRGTLIQRVSSVMELVDCLQSKKMVGDEMYNNIQAAKTSQEKMRIVYEVLQSGGTAVKAELYEILKLKQHSLVEDLESSQA